MPPAKKLTQAQKEILALYRRGLRMIKTKEQVGSSASFRTRPGMSTDDYRCIRAHILTSQEHRRDFTIYLRYFFKHPSWGGGLRRRDFAQIEYMQRRTARLLETTFEPKSVKHINLPKDIEQDMHQLGLAHWRRSFRDAASASADSNPSPAATIPGST